MICFHAPVKIPNAVKIPTEQRPKTCVEGSEGVVQCKWKSSYVMAFSATGSEPSRIPWEHLARKLSGFTARNKTEKFEQLRQK